MSLYSMPWLSTWGLRFSIVEIEDPEQENPTIIQTFDPTIEPDGSLDLTKISWVKEGDIFLVCSQYIFSSEVFDE